MNTNPGKTIMEAAEKVRKMKQGGLYEDATGRVACFTQNDGRSVSGFWADNGAEFSYHKDFASMIFRAKPVEPQKKRLMTPAECAGKWIAKDVRHLVDGFSMEGEGSIKFGGGLFYAVKYWHGAGWKISDTPTSEPYSLEIEE